MTLEVLALKYRPKTFSEVIGQKINAIVLDRMVASDSVPQGLLFAGPRGSGKTSMARILANSLDAGEPIEVDAASHGLVADVREMIENLRYTTGNAYRVIIYDEAHSMTKEAFNALLKTLEEPPSGTIFILVTTEPEKIPETVKSRLMEFTFRKVTPSIIMERLVSVSQAENIEVTPELLTYIADRADGSVRDALMLLDQCWKAGISSKDELRQMSGEEDVAPDLILAMLTKDHSYIFKKLDELSQRVPDPTKMAASLNDTLKDILILRAGGEIEATGEGLAKRKTITSVLESERIIASMRMLWELKTRIRAASNPRSNLDLAVVLISDIFTQGKQPMPRPDVPVRASDQENSRRLTLDEL